jgi:pimeloyl-ACP methyl ester carboxylesterase
VFGNGPVDLFASSGGAVNALALVARHPGQVRTLVAHEPPVAQILPDREALLAACAAIHDTYESSGYGPAMAKFIALVSYQGPVPDGFASQPGPDPAMFGLPAPDDGSRDDPLVGQNILTCNGYQHDFSALRTAPARIVVGVGAETGEAMVARAARAVAERLGTAPVTFPGGHDGFVGGEYGGMGKPDEFAATLREVLAS